MLPVFTQIFIREYRINFQFLSTFLWMPNFAIAALGIVMTPITKTWYAARLLQISVSLLIYRLYKWGQSESNRVWKSLSKFLVSQVAAVGLFLLNGVQFLASIWAEAIDRNDFALLLKSAVPVALLSVGTGVIFFGTGAMGRVFGWLYAAFVAQLLYFVFLHLFQDEATDLSIVSTLLACLAFGLTAVGLLAASSYCSPLAMATIVWFLVQPLFLFPTTPFVCKVRSIKDFPPQAIGLQLIGRVFILCDRELRYAEKDHYTRPMQLIHTIVREVGDLRIFYEYVSQCLDRVAQGTSGQGYKQQFAQYVITRESSQGLYTPLAETEERHTNGAEASLVGTHHDLRVRV